MVDDAAQAHGAAHDGLRLGSLAWATAWSFHAAKIISCGEGGMVTTNSKELADEMRLLRDHGMDPNRRYWHPVIGYNYRMTNLHAAIGLAQVEQMDTLMEQRAEVIRQYRERLGDLDVVLPHDPYDATNVCWLFSVLVPPDCDRDGVIASMAEAGVETRPFFYPLHRLPPYAGSYREGDYPVSCDLSKRGISLPASASLQAGDIDRIAIALEEALVKNGE